MRGIFVQLTVQGKFMNYKKQIEVYLSFEEVSMIIDISTLDMFEYYYYSDNKSFEYIVIFNHSNLIKVMQNISNRVITNYKFNKNWWKLFMRLSNQYNRQLTQVLRISEVRL